jgi:hypothetical protein
LLLLHTLCVVISLLTVSLSFFSLSRRVATRAQSTSVAVPKKNFQKDWLSDPSTYPLIAIMSIAASGCAGFMAYKLTYCPDVRITNKTKVSPMDRPEG